MSVSLCGTQSSSAAVRDCDWLRISVPSSRLKTAREAKERVVAQNVIRHFPLSNLIEVSLRLRALQQLLGIMPDIRSFFGGKGGQNITSSQENPKQKELVRTADWWLESD